MGKKRQSGAYEKKGRRKKRNPLVISGQARILERGQTDRREIMDRILVWFFVPVFAAITFYGVLLDFVRVWQLEYRQEFTVFVFFLAFLITCFLCLGARFWPLRYLPALFLFVAGFAAYSKLFEGAKTIFNLIINDWNLYYETSYSMLPTDERELFVFVYYVIAWLILFFLWGILLSGKRMNVLIPGVGIVCLGLLVGKEPDFSAFVWMVSGTFPSLVCIMRPKSCKIKKLCFVFGVFAAGLLVYERTETEIAAKMEENHQVLLEAQRELEQQAIDFLRDMEGGFSIFGRRGSADGAVRNKSPHYTDKEMLWISVSEKPETKLYFRGFVGSAYEDGTWKPVDSDAFASVVEGTPFSQEEAGKLILNQSYQYGTWKNVSSDFVEILYSDDCGEYAYLPYFSGLYGNELSGLIVDADAMLRRKEELYHLSFPMLWMDAKQLGSMDDMYMSYIPSEGDFVERYMSMFSSYYKQVPTRGVERILSLADTWKSEGYGVEMYDFNYAIPIHKVVEELRERTTYSLSPGRVPYGEDVVEYFLLDNKKGFCVHYASAAVLLLRRLGVPTRYVTGYTIEPEAFEKNSDGSYTATVVDRDAHAWAEVFMGIQGWIPIEVTAGVNSMNYGEDETSLRNAQIVRDFFGSEEETKSPTTAQQEKPTERNKSSDVQKNATEHRAAGKNEGMLIVIISGICIFVVLLCVLYVKRREAGRRKRRNSQDTRVAVMEISFSIYDVLRRANVFREKYMTDEEYIHRAEEWMKEHGEQPFLDFMECVRRTAFSDYIPTKEEAIEGRRIYESLLKNTKNQRAQKKK